MSQISNLTIKRRRWAEGEQIPGKADREPQGGPQRPAQEGPKLPGWLLWIC